MSRYGLLTEAKIARWLKEGRGFLERNLYQSWHQWNEFPSMGLSCIYWGLTSQRLHHVFSLVELNFLRLFDWLPHVIDIREQFPLLPRRETVEISKLLRIRHPFVRKTKTLWVMTTDFLLTVQRPEGIQYIAIAIKWSTELEKTRVLEKLAIEALYWRNRGITWMLLTEKDLPHSLIRNIRLVRPHTFLCDRQITEELLATAIEMMKPEIEKGDLALRDIAQQCDVSLGLQRGLSLSMVYHMIATFQCSIDMTNQIKPSCPLTVVFRDGEK
jgi:hypothetical protein